MMNISLSFIFILPLALGLILFFLGERDNLKKNLSLGAFFLTFTFSMFLFLRPQSPWHSYLFNNYTLTLGLDRLSRLILVFANLFGVLVCLYSKDYMPAKRGYFSWLLLLMVFTNLEILAMDFIIFVTAWAGSIVTLYALLNLGSKFSAKKAATILGFSWVCFIAGAAIYFKFSGSASMFGSGSMVLGRPISYLTFCLMLVGALAKVGSGPFHTWIPTASENAPIPVMAILPASLDKLLGVYILSRLCLDFFVLNDFVIILLLVIGSLTIIFAVLMALIQHDLRKLLAYHAISQAGYMVLGLGTGNPIGIIGAIFHMFNNAIYKNGLFLVGGAVEKKKGTFDLEQLGGLARYMPLTFICGLILSLSISGIPPFNGFASKWMIYQGALLGLVSAQAAYLRFIYAFALIAAMFGSALTLASFIKFIHAIFLGQDNNAGNKDVTETSWKMLAPLLVLSGLCVFLGIFSNAFIKGSLAPSFSFVLNYGGTWNSMFVSLFLGIAMLLGFVLWRAISSGKKVREDSYFTGGELGYDTPGFPATEFYKTIENIPLLANIYRFLKNDKFDIYNILSRIIGGNKNAQAKTKRT
ncbi:MAG: proton-conducting transporter membrane subunit [Candidatus Omnitrophota bacterium]|jgi:formate hydrogenlyase subunit 3/multisubunit Na+/H+ antiporter MnhD subunit